VTLRAVGGERRLQELHGAIELRRVIVPRLLPGVCHEQVIPAVLSSAGFTRAGNNVPGADFPVAGWALNMRLQIDNFSRLKGWMIPYGPERALPAEPGRSRGTWHCALDTLHWRWFSGRDAVVEQ